jgi:SAM-dependent methyltransferase
MNATGNFDSLVSLVGRRSPLQKKKLDAYLARQDDQFRQDAEDFATRYGEFLQSRGISLEQSVDAYLKLCNTMLRCQIDFMRTGRYPTADAATAAVEVYSDSKQMLPYMVGLAISQYLWETHRAIFQFFAEELRRRHGRVRSYLEIGPGHGLFLDRALNELGNDVAATAVDISPTSIDITRAIMEFFRPAARNVTYRTGDIMTLDLPGRFDFITIGEVLEHVDAPGKLLDKIRALLAPGGVAFVSTCANCPAVDHVYQFNNVGEIRALLTGSGLRIERDAALPAERLPMDEVIKRRITVNYCAMVTSNEPH